MTRTTSTLVAFSRPHTIAGTAVAVVVLFVTAAQWVGVAPGSGAFVLVLALVSALATNLYIVGVNQVTDVAIDRINKPWLPLAAGTLTMPAGRALVAASAVVAVAVGAVAGRWMLLAAAVGIAVGSAYSLPPLRFKRSHVLAAVAITSVRALVVNLVVFLHFQQVLGEGGAVPAHVWALTGMVLGLTIAIAWFKDLPDTEGDAVHRVSTLVLVLGARRVLGIGLAVLGSCFLAVVVVAAVVGLPGVSGPVLAVGHLGLLGVLVAMARRVDLADQQSVRRFYAGIWRLFVAEYLVFLAAVVLA